MSDGETTYTQEDVDALIAERVQGLEKKRNELLSEAKAAKAALKKMQEDNEEAAIRMQDLEQKVAAQSAGVGDEKLKELTAKLQADFERKYAPFKERVGELEAALGQKDGKIRELLLDTKVKAGMGSAGVRPERIEALFKLTAEQYDLTEEGEVIVKDNREIPLDKHFKEVLSNEYPELFLGSGSSGGGASRSAASGGGHARTIAAGDQDAFMANLSKVASGEVKVAE